jgi:flagellar hook-basal body complex protein FliE
MAVPLIAVKAYAQAAGLTQAGPTAGGPQAASDGGFGDILKHAISDAMSASKNAETQMTAQMQGKANLVDVVTAISSAETSLQTVMAVRDQAIAAYQQVMQMPI